MYYNFCKTLNGEVVDALSKMTTKYPECAEITKSVAVMIRNKPTKNAPKCIILTEKTLEAELLNKNSVYNGKNNLTQPEKSNPIS